MKQVTRNKLNNFISKMNTLYVTMRDIVEMCNNDEELRNVVENASYYPFCSISLGEVVTQLDSWVESANRQVKMVLFADDLYTQCVNVSEIMDGDLYSGDMSECLEMVMKALKTRKGIEWESEDGNN